MAETAHYQGEGGAIFAMTLPLPEVMQEKVTKGYLRRVNDDGSPYVAPAAEGGSDLTNGTPPRPAQSAQKAEWVGYAVLAGGMKPDDAEALTKQDLVERFGKAQLPPVEPPAEPPVENA